MTLPVAWSVIVVFVVKSLAEIRGALRPNLDNMVGGRCGGRMRLGDGAWLSPNDSGCIEIGQGTTQEMPK